MLVSRNAFTTRRGPFPGRPSHPVPRCYSAAFQEFGDCLTDDRRTRLLNPLTQGGQCLDLAVGKVDERAHWLSPYLISASYIIMGRGLQPFILNFEPFLAVALVGG